MTNQMIAERLKKYKPKALEDEENALKEILQEIALYALSTTDFFTKAIFQGGTSLRILYQLPRFSEDLDFLLKKPDPTFQWKSYLDQIADTFALFDIEPEVLDRSKANRTVQKMFLKDNSIGKILNLHFSHHKHKKLTVKLEIDTNPPAGANEEMKFLDFPLDYSIYTPDLPSNFAGKCHALLCRTYLKGRDWFDFSWYVAQRTPINFEFLQSAIEQNGPWSKQNIEVTKSWLISALTKKIHTIDWEKAALEVTRFVNIQQQASLKLWEKDFFLHKLKQLEQYQ